MKRNLQPTDKTINVEIKTGIVFYQGIEEKVLELTKAMGMEDRVLYSSFNHSTCVRIKELKPDAYVGFLYADGPIGIAEYAKKYNMDAVHPALWNLQYPDLVKSTRECGLDINTWTVNEREHMQMACMLGVNAIITNYPDVGVRGG